MNLFELVEILQRVRGVDRKNTEKTHHEDKRAQKREFSPQAVKERKENKRTISSSECWMGSSSDVDGESLATH